MIYFFPSMGIEQPSSYLRVYKIVPELIKLGIKASIIDPKLSDYEKRSILENTVEGDIIYIQKFFSNFHVAANFSVVKNKCPIVYDFDDRDTRQVHLDLLALADVIIVGSHFLREITLPYNSRVCVLCSPTDTELYKPLLNKINSIPVVVWSEWYANAYMEDLLMISGPLAKLKKEIKFKLILQGWHREPGKYRKELDRALQTFSFAEFDYYRPVKQFEKEGILILQGADIGIIPFKKRVSKAGQNLRSFMAMGLAVIGSPRSEQQYIIQHGINGYLADSEQEWYDKLKYLLTHSQIRRDLGQAARKTIETQYSMPVYIDKLIKVLSSVGAIL